MFDNIGNKIKSTVKLLFGIQVALSLVAGIVILAVDEDLALIAILVILGGPLLAWLSSLVTYALGEIAQTNIQTEENTKQILLLLEESVSKKKEYSKQPQISYDTKNQAGTTALAEEKEELPNIVTCKKSADPIPAIISGEQKICPVCKTAQKRNREVCWSCSQPFSN